MFWNIDNQNKIKFFFKTFNNLSTRQDLELWAFVVVRKSMAPSCNKFALKNFFRDLF